MNRLLCCLIFIISFGASSAFAELGYFRYPALRGETVTFTAEGDIWSVPVVGGRATRLTTHHSLELRKAISPDGKTLAFNAAYEGPTEVWTMPITGGQPRRITFEGQYIQVQGWTPEGKILGSTSKFSGPTRNYQLIEIDPENYSQTLIPLYQASEGVWDDEQQNLFFTRFSRQSSYTKRYKGGTAQNLWSWTNGAEEAVPLTADYPGTSRYPMWWGGRVYFVTDRDGTMNLWSMTPAGDDLKQHTHHAGFDISEPALDAGRVVYQLGADLRLFDIASGEENMIPIELVSDFEQTREKWITSPASHLSDVAISPDGDRVALVSRGRMFVTPIKDGRFQEVSRKQGVRYRDVTFAHDGKTLIALSDESGEYEFWRFDLEGIDKRTQITHDGDVLRYGAKVSPDGKKFLWQDKNQRLWVYDFAAKKSTLIARSDYGTFSGLEWSPNSAWIAYSTNAANEFAQVWLYEVKTEKNRVLTSERIDAHSPTWSRDGNRLFFIVDQRLVTEVSSPWGMRQPEPFFDNTSYIYELPLKSGLRSIYHKPNEATRAVKLTVSKEFDFRNLALRMQKVPLSPGNYSDLTATSGNLFFIHKEKTGSKKAYLRGFKLSSDPGSPRNYVTGITSYSLSQNGAKILARQSSNLYVFDGRSTGTVKVDAGKISLSGWAFPIDPREEWRQMFVDAWRMERDYFYDRGLHGVDWQAELDRHLPLVERVTDRSELNDLLTQIVGELEALHIFVSGGDSRSGSESIQPGSLGVEIIRDEPAGGYRIVSIPVWNPDYPEQAPALLQADPDLAVGDVILSINRVPVLDVVHPALLLRNQTGKEVLLELKLAKDGSKRPVLVTPISASAFSGLKYNAWEQTRREEVEAKGTGEIGYIHLRAMGSSDMAAWVEQYFPVYRRSGLIIDVRYNNGGNIDSWILNRLVRKAWFFWQPRVGKPTWNMHHAFRGHIVVLCNEWTASDGEAFTEGVRRLGIGTVIGTRTWGGEIWLSRNNPLVDSGMATAAQMGVFGPEGEWLIEGHGVDPDVVVDNLPHETFLGRDRQLEAAIEYLNKKIAEEPIPEPVAPPYYRRPDAPLEAPKIDPTEQSAAMDETVE